jgi:hypothetical protein
LAVGHCSQRQASAKVRRDGREYKRDFHVANRARHALALAESAAILY